MITAYFVAVANEFSSSLHLNSGYSAALEIIGSEEGFNISKIEIISLVGSQCRNLQQALELVFFSLTFFGKLLQNDSYSMSDLMTILLS